MQVRQPEDMEMHLASLLARQVQQGQLGLIAQVMAQ